MLIISWIDDLLIAGPKELVLETKELMKEYFECDDIGELTDYVGVKLDQTDGSFKMTQPVLLQSLVDEFDVPSGGCPNTPATPGEVLPPLCEETQLGPDEQFLFRSAVGKMLHLVKWSRPEISNAVRELTRFMSGAGLVHQKAMYRTMKY